MAGDSVATDPETGEVWYRIDAQDRIVEYGGAWRITDSEAAAGATLGQGVIGSRVYDHVAGHFTRRFLKEFFHRVRAQTRPLTRRTYRCDSPGEKVLVEMTARVEADGSVITTHRDLDIRKLPFEIAIVDVRTRRRASAIRCSMCNRLRRKDGDDWREPEEVVTPGVAVGVIHTVCLDCRNGVSARARW